MVGDAPPEALRRLYLEAARKDIASLERLIVRVVEEPAYGRAARADMRRVTHDIMGQGGAFGYPLMTRVGKSLSHLLNGCEDLDGAVLELVRDHVALLRAALERPGVTTSARSGDRRAARLEQRVEALIGRMSPL